MIVEVRVTPEMLDKNALSGPELEQALRNAIVHLVHPLTGKSITLTMSPVINVSDGVLRMSIY